MITGKKTIVKKPCEECEGSGEIFFGMKPGFNVKNMEITADDDTRMCSSCEGMGLIESEETESEITINPAMATSVIILDTTTGQSDYLDLTQDNLPLIISYLQKIEELANG